MSVRFSGSGQQLTNNAGLPVTRLFTVACWAYPVTLSGAAQIFWSLDSSSSQFATMGSDASGNLLFNWAGGGTRNSVGQALTAGAWNYIVVIVNGVSASLYQNVIGSGGSGLISTFTQTGNFALPTGALTLSIGGSANFLTSWPNVRIASFKMWDAALSASELYAETISQMPRRTTNLSRWYPFLQTEGTDYSGNSRTLIGGTGSTTDPGPPIPWRTVGGSTVFIPRDPSAPVWYAVYRISDGTLFSGDWSYNITLPLPDGMGYKTYPTQPDLTKVVWEPSVLDFIGLEGPVYVERFDDLLADGTLSSVWPSLNATQIAALRARIKQMLGPTFWWRYNYQEPDIPTMGSWPIYEGP